ncbi:hypothetical protein [Flavisolibacter ginsengisoli]|uniref:hypothetical protein n=1 Tax=Flavisolibacter ginsengisoli TaxID=462367 RepID=UPI001114BFC6|nr:hypothetical protein [Flavisolibacter ginsengisoli]
MTTTPAWFVAWVSGYVFVADIGALWGSLVMVLWIWNIIGNPFKMVQMVRLSAASLCAIQNISWLTASVIHRFLLNTSIKESLNEAMMGGLQFTYYASAIFYIGLFATVLAYIGSNKKITLLEKKLCTSILKLRFMPISTLIVIIVVLFSIELSFVIKGIIGQRTIITENYENGEMPFWIVFYESLIPAHIMLNALLVAKNLQLRVGLKRKINWCLFSISFVLVLFLYFNKGRAPMIFSLLAHGYWICFFTLWRPKFLKVIILLCICYPLFSQVLLFSNFMRNGGTEYFDWKTSAIDIVPKAWQQFQSSKELILLEEENTTNNLATRPLVATPLALCIQLPFQYKSYMLGENLFNSAISAIPGPIFPYKKDYPTQEELLYDHFPIGDKDTADSLYLSSYAEFGWGGIIIYPFFVVIIWFIVLSLSKTLKLSGFIKLISLSIFFYLFILGIGEASVNSWFVSLRSFFFWVILYYFSTLLFSKRIR